MNNSDIDRNQENNCHSVSLKDYLEHRVISLEKQLIDKVTALDRQTEASRISLEKQTELTRHALEKRLEGMNEFREQLKQQASSFITKDEYDIRHKRVEDKIAILHDFQTKIETKASQTSMYVSVLISVISIAISILLHFWK